MELALQIVSLCILICLAVIALFFLLGIFVFGVRELILTLREDLKKDGREKREVDKENT